MKFKALLLSFVIILVGAFVGCKQDNVTSDNNVVSENGSNNASNGEILQDNSIYSQFINGKITATDSDGYKYYVNQYDYLDNGFSYAFCDMDSDNVEELCIKNLQLYIFDIKDDEVYNLYTETRANSTVLNDGALFQVLYGGEPEHRLYDYRKIDADGNIKTQLYFSWWDAQTTDGAESYYIGEKSVTKKEYELLWTKHSNFADDKVIWTEIKGENNTKTDADIQNTQTGYKNIDDELNATIEAEYEEALNNAWSTADMCDVHIQFANRLQRSLQKDWAMQFIDIYTL